MLDPQPYRALFPHTERWAFFNHAGVSALSTRVEEATRAFNQKLSQAPFNEVVGEAVGVMSDLRSRVADLINASSADEIVLMPNTAMGLNTAAVSLPLRPGDNVLVLDGDYPANVYPWQNLAYRGVLTKMVPARDGGVDLDLLKARIDSRTRAIALSTVQFASGFRNDLVAVGKLCKERGIFFVVDGIQSLGALPLDVREANIDMLACGSQKWLMGPMGSGFLYVRQGLLDQLQPGAYVGAGSVVDWPNYLDYNLTPLPTAERFNLGSQNFAGIYGLHASLSLLQEIGIDQVSERILSLADLLIDLLRDRGFASSPSARAFHRSGIVIAEVDSPAEVEQKLYARNFVCIPRGKGIRIAPHFYNTEDEIRSLVDALVAIAGPRH